MPPSNPSPESSIALSPITLELGQVTGFSEARIQTIRPRYFEFEI